ncbi:PREDICTED: pleckstrin homology domain-containing family H member 1-like [Priapulus caudatus]|uniref:Pleckstrin homology domain-containing family H member 1-like n=1 Tax=Priapulus caudatus TaxID=37621 RepID=A0ABM1EZQ1_PRICU|nr:PREDICTED: pleckstrin homology domain-containing family H member 1-like [Priapulus caudatus]
MFPDYHESYLSTSNSDDAIERSVITEQAQVHTRPKTPPPAHAPSPDDEPPPPPPAPRAAAAAAAATPPPVAAKPNGLLTNGIAIRRVDGKGVVAQPPSPPLHRVASWENDIYRIAEQGVCMPQDKAADDTQYDIEDTSMPVTEELYTAKVYEHLSIPVYAALHGRASLIRNRPFSGDSSDSSDNEEFVSVHSSPTTTKSLKKDDSQDSNLSDDYYIPPDALIDPDMQVVKPSKMKEEFKNKLLDKVKGMSSAQSTSSIQSKGSMHSKASMISKESSTSTRNYTLEKDPRKNKTVILEKSGYLSKLGGRVKTWKKHWFVIRNGELLYYKTQNDRRPAGRITLDSQCSMTKAANATTFQVESKTKKRTYYLAGDSEHVAEEWVKAIQDVLKRTTSRVIFEQNNNKAVLKGWLTKVKHGHTRKCWCVLSGKNFIYYRNQNDRVPIGTINMKTARVEEIVEAQESDDEGLLEETSEQRRQQQSKQYTLAIHVEDQGTTYLLINTKEDKEDKEDRTHTRSCQLFMSVLIDRAGIDYHVVLAQNALQLCLAHPELQNEMYCQLIKQTTKHPTPPKSGVQNLFLCASHSWFLCDSQASSPTGGTTPNGSNGSDKLNPASFVFIQGWMLLAMCMALFLPRQHRIMWYLKTHLQRHADTRSELGKYAMFCQRALERCEQNGGREAKPSRMEALSIITRNPYTTSRPCSIPVHFLNATYQGDSNTAATARYVKIWTSFHVGADTQGEAVWQNSSNSQSSQAHYKNRLYFKSQVRGETDMERLLLCYQVALEITEGRFPLSKEMALELTALMVQIEHGDYRPGSTHSSGGTAVPPCHLVQQVVDHYHPKHFRINQSADESKNLVASVQGIWEKKLRGRSQQDCVRCLLTAVRKWPFFGAKLYHAKSKAVDSQKLVWLAVQEKGVDELDHSTMELLRSFPYKVLVTFGGFKDDLMLVMSNLEGKSEKPEKQLFHMKPVKIMDITQLIASYINGYPNIHLMAGGHGGQAGVAVDKLASPGTPPGARGRSNPAALTPSSGKELAIVQDRRSDVI